MTTFITIIEVFGYVIAFVVGFIAVVYVKNYFCWRHRKWKITIHIRQQEYKCVCPDCENLKQAV